MKTIVLHAAALTNAGKYLDAGSPAGVGDGDDQISADRARDLVNAGRAVALPALKPAE